MYSSNTEMIFQYEHVCFQFGFAKNSTYFLETKKSTDSNADIFSGFGSISNLISNMKSVDLPVTFSNRDLMAISYTLSSGDVFHNFSDN